jgi:hypothetical protein
VYSSSALLVNGTMDRFQELERRLQESERRRKEERRRRKEERRRRKEEQRLRKGTFYSTIEEVWTTKSMDYSSRRLFKALRRKPPPSFSDSYTLTRACALDEHFVAVENSTRSGTVSNIWPKDIFGGDPEGAHVAHLIPNSYSKASLFFDVVTWALGFRDNVQWWTLQKAIHGAKEMSSQPVSRTALTGIKHSVSNKIRLACQFDFFDQNPCVLIIPILDLDEMKRWNGEGYNAIVMCGSIEDESVLPSVIIRASKVCQRIGMIERGPIASDAQIEKARQLLERVLLGMAHSLLHREIWNRLPEAENLRRSFRSTTGIKKLLVPDAIASTENLKVRVVTFSNCDAPADARADHPAPDPLLLSVKAAINWSRRHHQGLRAAGERPEEEDELDVLAGELFLERLEKLHRPKTRNDLAWGLGQPFGYKGVDGVTV